jgi:sigma-B regulation protein RsbU (phosphoserine phosphatase)
LSSPPTKGIVLIADGEAAVRDVLHFYLKRTGYQVIQAADGHEALLEMAKVQPDMIMADLGVAEISGDRLCRLVKGNPETKNIYFILMLPLGDVMETDIDVTVDALSVGADDTITKPLRSQELLARVGSAFRIIAMQKEIKQQNRELVTYRENMQRDIELAAHLQASMLPEAGFVGPYRYTHKCLPFGGVGGDTYDVAPLRQGGAALMLADVSGHGVTAALISAIVKTSFENHIRSQGSPLAWATGMNRDLVSNTLEEQYATVFLAKLDPEAGTLTYVCAGHEPPIHIVGASSGKPRRPAALKGSGHPLGMDADFAFSEASIRFSPGDRLVLYTDGLVEAESDSKAALGEKGLLKLCADLPQGIEDFAETLLQRTKQFNSPVEFSDDVTLVVVDHTEDGAE